MRKEKEKEKDQRNEDKSKARQKKKTRIAPKKIFRRFFAYLSFSALESFLIFEMNLQREMKRECIR